MSRLIVLICVLIATWPVTAHGAPGLWQVKHGDTTIYLFGSIHALSPDFDWKTKRVDAAIASSDELWLEVADLDDSTKARTLISQYGLDPSRPLSARLDPDHRAALSTILQALALPPSALDTMRPWLASITLTLFPLQKIGVDSNSGVDLSIKRLADARHEPVKGFETYEEQIKMLAELGDQDALDMVNQSLDAFNDTLKDMAELEAAWRDGDVEKIDHLMRSQTTPSLYARLIVQRNLKFANGIAKRLTAPGTAFVVVGAGHLAGADSVQAHLQKLGFTVQRLDNP